MQGLQATQGLRACRRRLAAVIGCSACMRTRRTTRRAQVLEAHAVVIGALLSALARLILRRCDRRLALLASAVCLLARTPSRSLQRTRAHAAARIHARARRCLHAQRRIRTQHLSHTLSVWHTCAHTRTCRDITGKTHPDTHMHTHAHIAYIHTYTHEHTQTHKRTCTHTHIYPNVCVHV